MQFCFSGLFWKLIFKDYSCGNWVFYYKPLCWWPSLSVYNYLACQLWSVHLRKQKSQPGLQQRRGDKGKIKKDKAIFTIRFLLVIAILSTVSFWNHPSKLATIPTPLQMTKPNCTQMHPHRCLNHFDFKSATVNSFFRNSAKFYVEIQDQIYKQVQSGRTFYAASCERLFSIDSAFFSLHLILWTFYLPYRNIDVT